MRGSGTWPAVVEGWLGIAPHGRGMLGEIRSSPVLARGLPWWAGCSGVRGGIWLVWRRGVLAEVSEPPSLPIRPFENAQIEVIHG